MLSILAQPHSSFVPCNLQYPGFETFPIAQLIQVSKRLQKCLLRYFVRVAAVPENGVRHKLDAVDIWADQTLKLLMSASPAIIDELFLLLGTNFERQTGTSHYLNVS